MSHFEPPIKDMLFALDEFIGLEKLNQIEGLNQEIDREFLSSIYSSAAEIASEVIAPTNIDGDRLGVTLKDGRVEVPPGYKEACLLYTSPSPRDRGCSRMPSSA